MIKQNILQYLDYKCITKYNFYKNTGITRGILDQDTGISEDNIAKFLAYFTEVNIEWLITGNGDMLNQQGSMQPKRKYVKVAMSECKGCIDKERIITALEKANEGLQEALTAYKASEVKNPAYKQTASG